MAYLNFNEAGFAAAVRENQLAPRAPSESLFSALEWLVIALAERDSLASLGRPGRLAKALSALFGRAPERRLAQPRLEALRRLAVLAWHRGAALPSEERAAFTAAGFTEHQADALLANIAGRRARA